MLILKKVTNMATRELNLPGYFHVQIVFMGTCPSKQGARTGKDTAGEMIHYEPTKKASKDLKWQLKAALKKYIPTACTLPIAVTKLEYHYQAKRKEILQALQKAKDTRTLLPYLQTPDLSDNMNKFLFDALKGIVMTDDKMVVAMDGLKKVWDYEDMVILEIKSIHTNLNAYIAP